MGLEWAFPSGRRAAAPRQRGLLLEGRGDVRLLLLHGLTGTPAELAYVALHLHHRGGYSVECPRLINHDQAIGVLARTTREALYADAEEHWRRAADAARRDGQRLVVGGLSLGALLALQLAAAHAGSIAGVVALSPTFFYDGWAVPWTHRLIPLAAHLPFRYMLFVREGAPYGLKDPVLRKRIAEEYRRVSLRGHERATGESGYAHFPVALFCEMRHIIADCEATLARIEAPLLVVQARDDEVTSPRNAQFLLDRAGSRRKELVLLENSYHIVTADLDRARVATETALFCRQLAQREPCTSQPAVPRHG